MKYGFYAWGLMIVVSSFIGFVVENLWLWETKCYIDNRNMNLPFLLGYGLACFLVFVLLGTPNGEGGLICLHGRYAGLCYYFALFVLVSVGEIALGYAVRTLCGFDYWDYTRLPFHFTKYTSLFTSLGFAALIKEFMRFCFEPIMRFAISQDNLYFRVFIVDLLILLVADFVWSFRYMIRNRNFYVRWMVNRINGKARILNKA